jgi:hypothetical protein
LKEFITIAFTFILSAHNPAWSYVINIPADYPTIQQGINAGSNGDTVLVHPGTYEENINFIGHNITLGSLFLTTGDTSYISQTIIDGDMAGTVVTFSSGEDSTAVIAGFTIRNGFASDGGGILCRNANPIIMCNHIEGNRAEYGGGGIYCDHADPLIQFNTIEDNRAHNPGGGGIYCYFACPAIRNNLIYDNKVLLAGSGAGIFCTDFSHATIVNNTISGNMVNSVSSYAYGGGIECCWDANAYISGNIISGNQCQGGPGRAGGISCFQADPEINNNIIVNNFASSHGGGIGNFDSYALIRNNLISRNSADSLGGGIFCDSDECILLNNTFTENTAGYHGGGFSCARSSYPEIVNCIFWGDSAGVDANEIFVLAGYAEFTYCDIEGGWSGTGNINVDPLFRDPQNDDFHLIAIACGDSADSPCIDAGDPTIFDNILDCDWGLGMQRSDMGAYGGDAEPYTDVTNYELEKPNRFILMQNYPNPFNASTKIEFSIADSKNVRLTVFDLLGRQVRILLDEYRQAGTYTVTFDGSSHSSGVYFYRLEAGETVEIKRMVLLK